MKSVKKLAFISLALGMLSSGLIASVAWFEPRTNAFSARISGSVVEEYFHCGKGTQDDPFVITRPVHYYHLTEFFQRETVLNVSSTESVTFGTDYLYFQVGYPLKENDSSLYVYDYDNTGAYTGTISTPAYSKTLNLSYFSGQNALMPIGTNEVPFFGSFDGGAQSNAANGITISNLNIKTSDTVLVGNTTTNRSTSDVGIFGYVADQKDSTHKTVIANAYFDNLTIDLSGASGTVVSDAGHVDAHTDDEIYVGYIAGHVHTYTNYSSTGPTNAAPIHDVYVNNAKIEGGATANSHFGYIGFADTIDGVPGSNFELADMIDDLESAAAHGQGSEWGGSIAFDSFNQRLHDKLNPGTSVRFKNGNTTYSNGLIKNYLNTGSSVTVYRGGSASTANTYLANDPATNFVVYNMIGAGTHQINSSSKGTGTTYTAAAAVNGTYEPLLINGDFSTSSKNTGYLTSSNYAYGSGHYSGVDGTVRSASYPNGQIANSINNTYYATSSLYSSSTGGPKMTYNGNQLEILTNSSPTYSNSNFRLIRDDYNAGHTVTNSHISSYTKSTYESLGLNKYKDARDNLETILSSSNYVHGIHFMGDALAANKTISVPNAIINGESKTNYPVLLSSVDFTVKEDGFITLFAGSYYPATSSTVADSFFELYKVNRSGDTISSISKIYKIYKANDGTYNYTTTANGTGTGTLVFDMNFLMNAPPKNNVVYYFEIPVGSGEFAIGAVSGKTAGSYLFYLDLSANGADQEQSL